MNEKLKVDNLLASLIKKEFPHLSESEQSQIAEILVEYISLLNDGRIEDADKLIRNNYEHLEKII